MNCIDLMSTEVPWIHPNDTVAQAANVMTLERVGWLPICGDDLRPIGVITDRDIAVRLAANDRPAGQTRVDEVMTAPVRFVRPDSPVDLASEMMRSSGVTRLPVLDEGGHLEGVITLSDLLAKGGTNAALASLWEGPGREAAGTDAGRPAVQQEAKPQHTGAPPVEDEEPVEETDRATLNPARVEAENVVSGRGNPLKEFPS